MRKTLPQAMERCICPTLLHGKILTPEHPGRGSTFSPPPNALSIRAQGENADIIWLKRCSKRRSALPVTPAPGLPAGPSAGAAGGAAGGYGGGARGGGKTRVKRGFVFPIHLLSVHGR